MRLKVSSAKWRPFCLSLNVLIITISFKDISVFYHHKTQQNTNCMYTYFLRRTLLLSQDHNIFIRIRICISINRWIRIVSVELCHSQHVDRLTTDAVTMATTTLCTHISHHFSSCHCTEISQCPEKCSVEWQFKTQQDRRRNKHLFEP